MATKTTTNDEKSPISPFDDRRRRQVGAAVADFPLKIGGSGGCGSTTIG